MLGQLDQRHLVDLLWRVHGIRALLLQLIDLRTMMEELHQIQVEMLMLTVNQRTIEKILHQHQLLILTNMIIHLTFVHSLSESRQY